MTEKRRQNLADTGRGSYYNQKEWVDEFLDDKDAFYNGNESDDGDNDDENYNENMEIVDRRLFPDQSFFKIRVLKNFANFTGKDLGWSFLLIK